MSGEFVRELLDDLSTEREQLVTVVRPLTPEQWLASTPAQGWSVRDQISHLAFFDGLAALSVSDPGGFDQERVRAEREGAAYDRNHLTRLEGDGITLLDSWRAAADGLRAAAMSRAAGHRVPWFGIDMSLPSMLSARIMEHWAHGLDVTAAVGAPWEPTDRLRHVAHLAVRARPYGYLVRGREPSATAVRVELVAPSGTAWNFGPDDANESIVGKAEDFCMVLVRRRHIDDTTLKVTGTAAAEWMEFGQAYAGPPGAGPPRRGQRPG